MFLATSLFFCFDVFISSVMGFCSVHPCLSCAGRRATENYLPRFADVVVLLLRYVDVNI